jgi:glycine betaine/proline transport system substrate-binding protein
MLSRRYLAAPFAVVAIAAGVLIPGVNRSVHDLNTAGHGTCGTVNIAVNDWVGYEADAYVVGDVAQHRLGCIVNYINVDEQISWQGFASGQVDVVLENWGHDDLIDLYIKQLHVAQLAGQTGNIGVIGWFVPPWMAQKYPDITSWKNLNKYANLFKTSESGGKGQLLDGDPAFVTNDEALVTNLHLDYKVVYAGSEAALIQAFRSAQEQKKPLIGYFYSPQWFLSEVPLVQVHLPPYTTGCDAVASKVDCSYPLYHLNKVISDSFANSGSSAVDLIHRFHWTNDDQNVVAKWITQDGMEPAAAAQRFVTTHPALVNSWVQG